MTQQHLLQQNSLKGQHVLAIFTIAFLPACTTMDTQKTTKLRASLSQAQGGASSFGRQNVHASYYGRELAGRRTASGERFNPADLTAAHRTLPFGTRLRITNPGNGRSVIVRINDRGPFVRGRGIDVSLAAAQMLGFAGQGTTRLEIEEL